MATTVKPAKLTVTITTEITLNGQDKGTRNVLEVSSVVEVSQRIVNVPTTERIILSFAATNPAAGEISRPRRTDRILPRPLHFRSWRRQ